MTPTKPRTRFGHQLRQELDRQGLSLRAFARRLNPSNPEVARRSLAKWNAGTVVPSLESRSAVAVALGLNPSHFGDDEDEEESELYADLDAALNALVRHAVDRASRERERSEA